MRRVSFPDFTAFSADAFWKSGEYFSLLSDHMDRLDLSCISASLFTPYLYTTFEMASRYTPRVYISISNSKCEEWLITY
jgi:hypothetical protein